MNSEKEHRNKISPQNKYDRFEYDQAKGSIIKRFEEQAENYPDRPAVKTAKRTLTYQDLNSLAAMLAGAILDASDLDRQTAALLFEHGIDMITGMLGALKAGKIYVPLDPNYPEARLSYILQDSASHLIVTNHQNLPLAEELANAADHPITIINLDTLTQDSIAPENHNVPTGPDQIAFIIYTSGSTGSPKGVVHTHGNLLHYIRVFTNQLHLNCLDRMALFTSYSHAAGIINIFSTILNGAAVCPYGIWVEGSMERLAKWLRDEKITIYHSIPAVYRYLMAAAGENGMFPNVRLVILGGEAVFKNDVELFRKHFAADSILVNFFGLSEMMVAALHLMDRNSQITGETVPIGFLADGIDAYLLNEQNEEAGSGETGEIVYRGKYLSPGYWNLPDKTNELFVNNPVTGEGLVFRSGDLGRLLADGSLEYLGRKEPTGMIDFAVENEVPAGETAEQLLHEFNSTRTEYPDQLTVGDLFEAQAETTGWDEAVEESGGLAPSEVVARIDAEDFGEKLLELKPLHDGAFNCEQDLVVTIATWQGRKYQLMFTEAWGFDYRPDKSGISGTYGLQISADQGDEWKNLFHYHGMQAFKYCDMTAAFILNIVKKELAAGRPVAVLLDTYWCPWDAGYQREDHDAEHFVLVVGIDRASTFLYCVDTIYMKVWEPLPIDCFLQGNRGLCETFAFDDPSVPEADWRKIVRDAVGRLQGAHGKANAFDAIRNFAADAARDFDIAKETEGYSNFLRAKLYRVLLEIARGRRQFAKSLEYLSTRYQVEALGKFSKELGRVGGSWESIRATLLKMHDLFKPETLLPKIVAKIKATADHEERIARQLLEVVEDQVNSLSIPSVSATEERKAALVEPDAGRLGSTVEVDLSGYLNSHGCGSAVYESCRADFNGLREFFIIESMPPEGSLEVAGMKFLFPRLADGLNDNIACTGQAIPIRPEHYSSLMILGCGDEGSFSEKIIVLYENGVREEVEIDFSCWWLAPDFGEIIAWEGKLASRAGGRMHLTPNPVRLYAQQYPLQNGGCAVGLKLPDCINLHLFAISLRK